MNESTFVLYFLKNSSSKSIFFKENLFRKNFILHYSLYIGALSLQLYHLLRNTVYNSLNKIDVLILDMIPLDFRTSLKILFECHDFELYQIRRR